MTETPTDLASFHVLEIHSYFSRHSVAEAKIGSGDLAACHIMVSRSEMAGCTPRMHTPSQSSQQGTQNCGVG